MKFGVFCAVSAVFLAGCQSSVSSEKNTAPPQAAPASSTGSETYTARLQAAPAGLTKAKIETCWKQAGIKGDLYKFMTPEEAAGVQPGGVFTKEKHPVFKACLQA
ncbi:MAG: 50S ribosomal protein L20 [Leisingera sp.]